MAEKNVLEILIEAFDHSGPSLSSATKNLEGFGHTLKIAGEAVLAFGVASVSAFGVMAVQQVRAAEEMGHMAAKAGTTSETFSTLAYAAKQSGVEVESLQTGFKKLSVNLIDAGKGNTAAQEGFQSLGINIRDTNGHLKTSTEVMKEVADKFAAMPDGARKAEEAVKLFGKSGVDMIPMLNQGSAAINQLQQRAKDLGLEISGGFAENAEEFNRKIADMWDTLKGVVNVIVVEMLPYLTELAKYFADKGPGIVAWVKNFMKSVEDLSGVWHLFGQVVQTIWVGVVAGIERVVSALTTIGAAMVELVSGNWRGMVEIVNTGVQDQQQIIKKQADDIQAIWAKTTEVHKTEVEKRKKVIQQAGTEEEAFNLLHFLKIKTWEEKSNQEKVEGIKQTLGTIEGLTKSSNIVLFRIGQAAAIANATIDGFSAIVKAFNATPLYFVNVGLAALTAAAVATNIASIASQPAPAFASGGIVPGDPNSGDNTLIRATPGEVILNQAQQGNVANALGQPIILNLTLGDKFFTRTINRLSSSGQLDLVFN